MKFAKAIFQLVKGSRGQVSAEYVLVGDNQVGFKVGDCGVSTPLVIDPILSYSTFFGGSSGEGGYGIAVDSSGNAYVAGHTGSTNCLPSILCNQRLAAAIPTH